MVSSKTLILLHILVVFVSLPTKIQSANVNQICSRTPNPRLCNSILQSDRRSSRADVTGVALILVDKIKANALATVRQIGVLYKQRPELRAQLNSCSFKYKIVLQDDVTEAQEALSKGNPKFAEDAVTDAGTEAANCEGGFRGRSPLTGLTGPMQQMSGIARAIVRMLL